MPQIIGLSFSLWPIIIGRATFCVVVVYNQESGGLAGAGRAVVAQTAGE